MSHELDAHSGGHTIDFGRGAHDRAACVFEGSVMADVVFALLLLCFHLVLGLRVTVISRRV